MLTQRDDEPSFLQPVCFLSSALLSPPFSLLLLAASGFKHKELRGKLAIGITANFVNRNTAAEAQVAEISGVARIYNQKFFQDLLTETGMDREGLCALIGITGVNLKRQKMFVVNPCVKLGYFEVKQRHRVVIF